MSQGNVLFLVCSPCEEANEADFGVKLAIRTRVGYYDPYVPPKEFTKWLAKHSKCGGRSPDHFKLGYQFPKDHDQQAIAQVVHEAVN